tara:strand:+ start:684 stop:890 length:207 start_codon:yes stop_codon:yes gene_type:complete
MQPIPEPIILITNPTYAQNEKAKNDIERLIGSFDDLLFPKTYFYESDFTITKPRKKNTHLIPKKKKRK